MKIKLSLLAGDAEFDSARRPATAVTAVRLANDTPRLSWNTIDTDLRTLRVWRAEYF